MNFDILHLATKGENIMDRQQQFPGATEASITGDADTAGKIAYHAAKDLNLPTKDIQAATATAIGTTVALGVTKAL